MSYRKTKFLKVLEPIKKGAYFYFTIPYGIFYICGAIAGYVRDKSYLCLGVSGAIGVVFILLGGLSKALKWTELSCAVDSFSSPNFASFFMVSPCWTFSISNSVHRVVEYI